MSNFDRERRRVIVAGSRKMSGLLCLNTPDGSPVKWIDGLLCMSFQTLHPHYALEIVSGASGDVDLLGEKWAKWAQAPCTQFHADWDQHGEAAGPIRNREMAEYASEKPGGAIVLIWNGESRGSASMLQAAQKKGLHVVEVKVPSL